MPVLQQEPVPASLRNPDSPADQALAEIEELLGEGGYDMTLPVWEGHAYLKIHNDFGALTDLLITSTGCVTWTYRSASGCDGDLIWQTRAPHHCDGGLALADIAGRISLALART